MRHDDAETTAHVLLMFQQIMNSAGIAVTSWQADHDMTGYTAMERMCSVIEHQNLTISLSTTPDSIKHFLKMHEDLALLNQIKTTTNPAVLDQYDQLIMLLNLTQDK